MVEKKTLPERLQKLDMADRPIHLKKIIRELEDAGEVRHC